jgi:hypothetical protein
MATTVLKAICLAIFASGLAALAGWVPDTVPLNLPRIAAILLAIHALELVFAFKHVRRYPGPLAASVLLTLLFGLLHWKPLADAARRDGR